MGEERMNTNRTLFLILCITLCSGQLLARPARADGPTVYVAPNGNDAWSGKLPAPNADRSDGPVATPARARDLVRANPGQSSGGPIRVEARGRNLLPERVP